MKFHFERTLDGIKTVGTANGAGLIASGAALNYFSDKQPQVVPFIKAAALSFIIGIFTFAFSMLYSLLYPYESLWVTFPAACGVSPMDEHLQTAIPRRLRRGSFIVAVMVLNPILELWLPQ